MGIPLAFTGGADAPVALDSDPSKTNGWAPETHDSYAPPLGAAGPNGATAATNPAPSTPALPERAPPRKAAPATAQTSKEAPKAAAAVPAAAAAKAAAAASAPALAGAPAEQGDAAPLLGKAEPLAGPATSPAPATGAVSGTSPAAGTSSGQGTSLEPKILNAPPVASAAAPAPAPAQAAASGSSGSARSAMATPAQPAPASAQPVAGSGPAASPAPAGTGGDTAALPTAPSTAAAPHSRDVLSGTLASGVAAALLAVLSLSAFALWRRVRTAAAIAGPRDISSITLDRAPKPVVPVRPAGTAAGSKPAAEKPIVASFAASEEFPVPTSYEEALKVLGAAPDASPAALKKIVDGMRQSWHPDHGSSDADRSYRERRLRQINVAWDLISKKGSAAA
jgi:hypothetical protein